MCKVDPAKSDIFDFGYIKKTFGKCQLLHMGQVLQTVSENSAFREQSIICPRSSKMNANT